jgi:hypothetical protein
VLYRDLTAKLRGDPLAMAQVTVQKTSDRESILIDNNNLILKSNDPDVIGFKIFVRNGKFFTATIDFSDGACTGKIPLELLTRRLGVYDIKVHKRGGIYARFGKSFRPLLTDDSQRLIGTIDIPRDGRNVFISPYVTYSGGGVSLLVDDSATARNEKVFGLLFANIRHITLAENILRAEGEFLMSGVDSANCEVSIVMKNPGCVEELVTNCKLTLRPDIHAAYAIGLCDYNSSGFSVRINLDKLVKKGMVNGRRNAFYIRIEHTGGTFESRVSGMPRSVGNVFGVISEAIEVHLEEHHGSGYLYLTPQRRYKIDYLEIEKIKRTTPGTLKISGCFAVYGVHSHLIKVTVIVRQRHVGKEYRFPVTKFNDPQLSQDLIEHDGKYGNGRFSAKIDIKKLSLTCFSGERFLDVYLEVQIFGIVLRRRMNVGSSRYVDLAGEYLEIYKRMLGKNDVVAYLTRGGSFLSFSLRERLREDGRWATTKEKMAMLLDRVLPKWTRSLWLTYETYSETAQDNSFYFFKWMMENTARRDIYYVIRRNSKDLANLSQYKSNVLYYYSLKHLLYMLRCTLFVSAQGRFHAYKFRPIKSSYKTRVMSKRFVFLQHGVTAFKKSSFKRDDPSGGADMVMVVSEAEKNTIVKNWGYRPEDVVVAGFSRFDVLTDMSDRERPVILVMPTWRSWLEDVDQAAFDESAFCLHYRTLLFNLEEAFPNADVKFYIHIKLAKYISTWARDFSRVKIVLLGDCKVNEMLMEASVLVTDYSSVAWDFLYMKKPTIFFQFDRKEYDRYTGSFVDFEKGLFGPATAEPDKAVDLVAEALSQGDCVLNKSHFNYTDQNNSLRIYRSIIGRFGR